MYDGTSALIADLDAGAGDFHAALDEAYAYSAMPTAGGAAAGPAKDASSTSSSSGSAYGAPGGGGGYAAPSADPHEDMGAVYGYTGSGSGPVI